MGQTGRHGVVDRAWMSERRLCTFTVDVVVAVVVTHGGLRAVLTTLQLAFFFSLCLSTCGHPFEFLKKKERRLSSLASTTINSAELAKAAGCFLL